MRPKFHVDNVCVCVSMNRTVVRNSSVEGSVRMHRCHCDPQHMLTPISMTVVLLMRVCSEWKLDGVLFVILSYLCMQ